MFKTELYTFFTLFFILILTSSLYGQRFNGGTMGGLVSSQVAGDGYSGFKKAGVFVGAFVNLDISDKSAFQMELEYFQKGSRQNREPEKGIENSLLLRLNYIELPVLYQYKFSERFKVEAGPSLGFNVGYFERADEDVISDQPDYNKPASVSFQINVGLYIYFLDNLAVNIRTNNSLMNIRSRNATGDVRRFWDFGQYNDALVLSVYYTFWGKGRDN
jgi:hypothetical protein